MKYNFSKPYREMTISQAYAAGYLEPANALLFRGNGCISKVIKTVDRSEYTHAAMLTFAGSTPEVSEIRELKGGRNVPLWRQVDWFPGVIDVYVANPRGYHAGFNREAAAQYMRNLAGEKYGYGTVLKAWFSHFWFTRLIIGKFPCLARKQRKVEKNAGGVVRPFCSMAMDIAYHRYGTVDPVPGLSSRLTSPGDFARSMFFEYACTLIPEGHHHA